MAVASETRKPKVRPPLWGISRARTVKPSISTGGVGLEPEEAPLAAQLGRGDREVRGRHDPAQDLLGVALGRHVEVGPALGPVRRREEGEALGVVPVEVPEHDRAGEGMVPEQSGHPADPGAGIEDEAGAFSVVGQRHARGVAPVADVGGARCGGGSPGPADRHLHAGPRARRDGVAPMARRVLAGHVMG